MLNLTGFELTHGGEASVNKKVALKFYVQTNDTKVEFGNYTWEVSCGASINIGLDD